MNRHYFNPTPGTVYENKGGSSYICFSASGHFEAVFQRVDKYKWTFTAHGCQMYDDGTIEWDGSTGGYFAEDKKTNKIDELRKKYPLRICRIGEPQYEAVLAGVQPLSNGKEFPMYRFPGGISCQDPFEPGIKIVEW